jgi:hypothetical protein
MTRKTIEVHGHELDLTRLYRAMHVQSHVEAGLRIYNGARSDTTSFKWLLAELFGLEVTATANTKAYGDARREATLELHRLGWATKVGKDNKPALTGTKSRTPRYILHADPADLT